MIMEAFDITMTHPQIRIVTDAAKVVDADLLKIPIISILLLLQFQVFGFKTLKKYFVRQTSQMTSKIWTHLNIFGQALRDRIPSAK